jgi:hypothetical protein
MLDGSSLTQGDAERQADQNSTNQRSDDRRQRSREHIGKTPNHEGARNDDRHSNSEARASRSHPKLS